MIVTKKLTLILSAIIVICLCLTGCGKNHHNPLTVNEDTVTILSNEAIENITYFLRPIVKDSHFELSLYVPDDYPIVITDFELWVNNQQIGGRTKVDSNLRHLILTKEKIENIWIRLYNDEEFVADCSINPYDEIGFLILQIEKKLLLIHP